MKEQDNRRLTSFRIEKELFIKLKGYLAESNQTMTDYLNDLIKNDLQNKQDRSKK